jgi:hypothetical protein
MALGKFGPRDWFAGFLVSLASGNGKNDVYVPAITLVDSTGNPTTGSDVTIVNGGDVTQGSIADAAVANGAAGTISAKLRTISTQLAAGVVVTGSTVGLVAGTALIGKVGIDQTTNGTTNGVTLVGYSFQNITTSTTTVVKSGAGVLHLVNVNALGTVASLVTIYDNTAGSGTKIGTINSLTLSGAFQYDLAFATGLTLVTTGAPDITVSYR